jgi:hypothetical protein
MLGTLERGQFPEIRQANFNIVVSAGTPLVDNPKFKPKWVKIPVLKSRNGNDFNGLNLYVKSGLDKGLIIIHKSALLFEPKFESRIAQFKYTISGATTEEDVFLARITDTFSTRDRGMGFGSALAILGERFLSAKAASIARQKRCSRVWSVSFDNSDSGWTRAILKNLGYENIDKLNLRSLVPSGFMIKRLF